jgi:hypothetical protein
MAGAAWLAGPVALLANARRYAEALEDIAATGRPRLAPRELRGRMQHRVVARLAARRLAERMVHRGTQALAVFAEGVAPEDALAAQATYYRQAPPLPARAVVDNPLAALRALFVDGAVVTLQTRDPAIERALAPLCEAGFLEVVRSERPGMPAVGAAVVVPALYARDELALIARRIALEVAACDAFEIPGPDVVLIAGCWAQRAAFVDALQRDLARLPGITRRTLVADAAPGVAEVAVQGLGCDDPIDLVAAATDRSNLLGARTAEIFVHAVHEDDHDFARALDRAVVGLRSELVGINEWPSVLALRGDAPNGPWMLGRVDKAVVRGPLWRYRPPLDALDHARAAMVGPRLAAFYAAPTLTKLARIF